MLKNIRIKALQDNYIWILQDRHKKCIIIDPGDAKKVINIIIKKKLVPKIILITHYHKDHIQGIKKLLIQYSNKKIYGPQFINKKYFFVTPCFSFTKLYLLKHIFIVLHTPGHTNHDISYFISPFLFCGDILFSGGCGKVLTGKYKDMFNSISLINFLPNNTKICSGHEYTLKNLLFSKKY
ncbi:probable hydroxyacylglutathione hydrolase [Buchnera aphidicola (Cinara tujafilina)]|uniref:Probable hydroxyacylglutathione hydrolase n=1 Tax=Buchnera aphidicola (Cinara tujafilina) TaxID=261317 RepID=F7WZ91_9GAMM|nr:MBL fold metallo-hydrolase [Buchnera aphidicola]AEH39745.1 probable hydroxyacylglutathione hydrolase [Buchnera aphidicola (Cinara tujafilina)]